MPKKSSGGEAPHGSRIIELKVRFFTNELAPGERILPKHAWNR